MTNALPVVSVFAESGVTGPAANAEAITPADTDLPELTRAIYVGGTGNLAVRMADDKGDADVVFSAIPAGTVLPIRVKQIRSTSTTATLIVALF